MTSAPAAHDPDQSGRSTAAKKLRMIKRAFNSKAVRTATFVLSIALMAWIVFSVW